MKESLTKAYVVFNRNIAECSTLIGQKMFIVSLITAYAGTSMTDASFKRTR